MRPFRDYFYLARDLWRFARGKDYFRQPQGLGAYFRDPRCYYNDLTGKSRWDGPVENGVPALYVPSTGKLSISPCMVLLWALGSLDCYFLEGGQAELEKARCAASWLLANILPEGYWDGGFQESDPGHRYHSNNSALTQGLALSFLARILENGLLDAPLRLELEELSRRVAQNVVRPLAQGGTALERGDDLYFLEFTRVDECIVFNGWTYCLFGIWDHARRTGDQELDARFRRSLETLLRSLPLFRRKDGWSCYDTDGRAASPFYHDLHISLLEALHRLTGEAGFEEQRQIFRRANSRAMRARYTLSKIRDKIFDQERYASQA